MYRHQCFLLYQDSNKLCNKEVYPDDTRDRALHLHPVYICTLFIFAPCLVSIFAPCLYLHLYCAGRPAGFELLDTWTGLALQPKYTQTWNLSKNLHNRRFQGKKFTQKMRNFRHLLNRDKKCVNALNWDKTSKKSLFYQFILAQHQ